MTKIKFIIILFIILIILSLCYLLFFKKKDQFDYRAHIRYYSSLLKQEPNNCFYLQQIASGYQALYDFDQAIKYYKETLKNCPDDSRSQFQLGVTYYVMLKKDLGLEWMDKAIKSARKKGDDQLAKNLQNDKTAWLEKWDLIEDWNKRKGK